MSGGGVVLGMNGACVPEAVDGAKCYTEIFEWEGKDAEKMQQVIEAGLKMSDELPLSITTSYLIKFLVRDVDPKTTRKGVVTAWRDVRQDLQERLHPAVYKRAQLAITMKLP